MRAGSFVRSVRTIITRAVGVRPFVELDETPVDVLPGDLYILCTDGLTRMLDDHTIAQLLTLHGTGNLNHTVRQLVREANIAGGKDNITILLVRVDDSSSASTRPSVHRRRSLMGWIRHLVAGLVGHPDQPACGPVR